jgi:hypothetical protein
MKSATHEPFKAALIAGEVDLRPCETMRARLAAAIAAATPRTPNAMADAVLKRLLEPTPEMVEAGNKRLKCWELNWTQTADCHGSIRCRFRPMRMRLPA